MVGLLTLIREARKWANLDIENEVEAVVAA
jgi:hypothetical protein